MATPCPNTSASGSVVVAQHMFLGASVISFNSNLGWGGNESKLNIELINDFANNGCITKNGNFVPMFPTLQNSDTDDHYYTCTDNSCYMDENGNAYDPARSWDPDRPALGLPPSKRRVSPGKVYHKIIDNGLASRYWRNPDPGFFGTSTLISPQGSYTASVPANNTQAWRYNLINAPVYFRFGYFTFGGFITNWTCNNRLSTPTYSVTVSSPDKLLDDCKVIVSKFGGSVFCSLNTGVSGGPTNYTGTTGTYIGKLKSGNLANVFNVYGFLESYGFGTSNSNDNGIPIAYALDALSVLTSAQDSQSLGILTTIFPSIQSLPQNRLGYQSAFSPFGRILSPTLMGAPLSVDIDDPTVVPIEATLKEYGFGIIPSVSNNGRERVEFLLDLSEIPRPPLDVRYSGSGQDGICSIKDLISEACTRTGHDFYTTIIRKNKLNYIKIKTISRRNRIPNNTIESVVRTLEASKIGVTRSDFGKTKNDGAKSRVMYIGANQQRLYQAKSYLLGYSNTHLIYHPVLKTFVNYYRFGQKDVVWPKLPGSRTRTSTMTSDAEWVDAIRVPMAYSTRNIKVSIEINGAIITELFGNEQKLASGAFATDNGFKDTPVGGSVNLYTGNYWYANTYKMLNPASLNAGNTCTGGSPAGLTAGARYIPLFQYAISPFFGYAHDQYIPIEDAKGKNLYRFIRPVYLDTWTGLITVVFRPNECPVLSLGLLPSIYSAKFNSEDNISTDHVGSGMKGGGSAGGVPPVPSTDTTKEILETPEAIDNTPFDYTNSPVGTIGFTITETEMRAADAGLDNYLAYCLQKLPWHKPDLFRMLVMVYHSQGKLFVSKLPAANVTGGAGGAGGMNAQNTMAGANANIHGPIPGIPRAPSKSSNALNYNFNFFLNHEFIKDLSILVTFIKNLHNTYYGRKYLVKLPEVLSYRDKQFADLRLQCGTDFISVYHGDGKIFFNYEITNEGAWEEVENYIDDCIVVGGPDYYKICEHNGLIKPIIGYNATPVVDYVSQKWCQLSASQRMKNLDDQISNISKVIDSSASATNVPSDTVIADAELGTARKKYEMLVAERTIVGSSFRNCNQLLVPSLDVGGINDEYIIVKTGDWGRKNAYNIVNTVTNGTGIIMNTPNPIPANNDNPIPSKPGKTVKTVTSQRQQASANPAATSILTYKLFAKTSCDENFAFLDPINLLGPRAIINAPGINLYSSSMSYVTDPNNTILSNASSEDYGILMALGSRTTVKSAQRLTKYLASISQNMKAYGTELGVKSTATCTELFSNLSSILLGNIVPLTDSGYLLPQRGQERTKMHMGISPRKANPMFAAIPLKNNTACYGPWTNYPDLITDDRLMGTGYLMANSATKELVIENLINDIDIRHDPSWAPWNFGGMSFLDREIVNQINSNATYQSVIEDGSITTYGLPLFSMSCGPQIKTTDSQTHTPIDKTFMGWKYHTISGIKWSGYAGLALSNMGVSVSDREIITTYRFLTYTQRLGLYSKEITERNKLIATNRIALRSEFGRMQKELMQKIISEVDSIIKNNRLNREGTDVSRLKSAIYGTSPTELLVGSSQFYSPAYIVKTSDSGIKPASYDALLPTNVSMLPTFLHNSARTKSFVGNFMVAEAMTELSHDYSSKSVMSMDGIFSPVSFYPSHNLGTFPISSRCKKSPADTGVVCPSCDNSGTITYSAASSGSTAWTSFNNILLACPMCSKSRVVFPSGDTAQIKEDDPPDINLISLNPIVVPYGDFRNPNSQMSSTGLERSRHNISVIGRQEFPPVGYQGLQTHDNLTLGLTEAGISDKEYGLAASTTQTTNITTYNPDYYEYDLSYNRTDGKKILANSRFFAFRGPMMLHGWGYDTDGYPVPNKADEPKEFDTMGRPKRFILTSSGTNDLKKDGKFLPGANELLGDVIGRGYVKENGEWTRKPTRYFHLNWAERSDLWPVGPIDLRWDAERKVWVGGDGCKELYPPYIVSANNDIVNLANFLRKKKSTKNCPYKLIYITLEEDMVLVDGFNETFPARGFIDDAEYSAEMLPLNARRLVYVKDRASYTAPRGAKLLCKYDKNTGFYEPISKQSFIVFGTTTMGNNAVVDLSYIQGLKSGENAKRVTIVFDNTRFNFVLSGGSKRGMFLYENGKWVLIGSN